MCLPTHEARGGHKACRGRCCFFFSVFIKNKNRKKGLWFLCFSFFFFSLFLERLVASSSDSEGWGGPYLPWGLNPHCRRPLLRCPQNSPGWGAMPFPRGTPKHPLGGYSPPVRSWQGHTLRQSSCFTLPFWGARGPSLPEKGPPHGAHPRGSYRYGLCTHPCSRAAPQPGCGAQGSCPGAVCAQQVDPPLPSLPIPPCSPPNWAGMRGGHGSPLPTPPGAFVQAGSRGSRSP